MRSADTNFNAFMRTIATLLLLLLTATGLRAQTITGIVTDASGGALSGVVVENVHTDLSLATDGGGRFSIAAKPGELVAFRMLGYKIARVRITSSTTPFYRIILEPGVHELEGVEIRYHQNDFKHDSMRYRHLFKKQLDFPVVTGWRAIQSPFTAMGKTNQQMISFQKEYAWLEQQKFIDQYFNEKLVANLTGLKGDSALQYMRQFRPSYEMLRTMQEYDVFSYIKSTAERWRIRQKFRPDGSRGGG